MFPANRIGGKVTINGAKGFHPRIKDRSDLTLECIRRTGVHDFRRARGNRIAVWATQHGLA